MTILSYCKSSYSDIAAAASIFTACRLTCIAVDVDIAAIAAIASGCRACATTATTASCSRRSCNTIAGAENLPAGAAGTVRETATAAATAMIYWLW